MHRGTHERAPQPRALHVFDLDGTLLQGAATLELTRHFGNPALGRDIEDRYLANDINDREFWEALLEACGDATPAEIDTAFHSSPWMAGIADTFADIRSRGEFVIVISQSPRFFVERLIGWGAHETYGSAVEIGRPVGDDATLAPEAKVLITRAALDRLALTSSDCVAYGDSASDIDLFRWLPHTVGVNASDAIADLASAHYRGADIRAAYALGRILLSRG